MLNQEEPLEGPAAKALPALGVDIH